MSISVAYIHAHQRPERRESFARLCKTLDTWPHDAPSSLVRVFGGEEPRPAWSRASWKWSLETGADHCLFLQDDVIAAPHDIFWPALKAMIAAKPDDMISFYNSHQGARVLLRELVDEKCARKPAFYSVSDCLGGPAFMMPHKVLDKFSRWCATDLQSGAADYLGEDDTMAMFAMATSRRILYPVVSIADHDYTLESNFGFVTHLFRRSAVTWQDLETFGCTPKLLTEKAFWDTEPVHLGRLWGEAQTFQCRDWIKGWTAEDSKTLLADRCPPEYDMQRWILRP